MFAGFDTAIAQDRARLRVLAETGFAGPAFIGRVRRTLVCAQCRRRFETRRVTRRCRQCIGDLVEAAPSQIKIAGMRADRRVSFREIGRLAGLPGNTVSSIMRQRWITRSTAHKILTIDLSGYPLA